MPGIWRDADLSLPEELKLAPVRLSRLHEYDDVVPAFAPLLKVDVVEELVPDCSGLRDLEPPALLLQRRP